MEDYGTPYPKVVYLKSPCVYKSDVVIIINDKSVFVISVVKEISLV